MRNRNNAAMPISENRADYSEDEIRQLYAEQNWSCGLYAHERLSAHHTLSSARHRVMSATHKNTPRDRLDLALSSYFPNNGTHDFVNLQEFYTQPETLGQVSWRLFRNDMPAPYSKKLKFNHSLTITNTTDRNAFHTVKVNAAFEHSVLTGPNFHRRADGGFFRV